MGSIKQTVDELRSISSEIKRLTSVLSNLRNTKKELEKEILLFLKEKDLPGVKYDGCKIIIEHKTKRITKKKEDKYLDAKNILKSHGIGDVDNVLTKILESCKGDKIEEQKIALKKLI